MPIQIEHLGGGSRRDLTLGGVLTERKEEDINKVLKVLGFLAVGQEAAAGVATELKRRGEGFRPRSLTQAALAGIQRKATFREITPQTTAGRVIGTAGDFLIDPLNIIPAAGIAGVGRKGVVAATKQLRKIPQMNRLMDSVGDKLVTDYALKSGGFADFLGVKVKLLGRLNQMKAQKLDKVEREILEILPDERSREKITRLLFDEPALQTDPRYARWQAEFDALSDVERKAFDLGDRGFKELEEIKIASGILEKGRALGLLEKMGTRRFVPKRLVDKRMTEDYIRGEIKKAEDVIAGRLGPVTQKQIAKAQGDLEAFREWAATIDDIPEILTTAMKVRINRGVRLGEFPSMTEVRRGTELIENMDARTLDMLERDVAKLLAIERKEVARAQASQMFLKEAAEYLTRNGLARPAILAGKLDTPASRTLLRINEARLQGVTMVPSKIKQMDGLLIPKPIADELDRVFKAYSDPGEMKEMLSVWRQLTGIWKAWTLSLFPAYHSRNVISNIWNNFLAGMGPGSVQDYNAAWRLLHKVKRGEFTGEKVFRGMTDQELYEKMLLHRVIDGGQFSEITQVFDDAYPQLVRGFINPKDNRLIQLGYKTGRMFEDHARMSHFMWKMRQGASVEEAAASVQKFLFDYQYGLTKWETKFLRDRIIPFWAWTRFNVPLQLEMLIKRPTKFTQGLKTIRGAEDEFGGPDPNEIFLAEWMKNSARVRMKSDKKGYSYFLLDSWWPASDIGKVLSGTRLTQELLNMVTPFLKLPAELMANYNLFQHRKIKQFPGQTKKVLGIPLWARAEHMARSVRVINEADRVIQSSREAGFLGAGGGLMRLLIGKSYPVDFEKQKRRWDMATRRGLGQLRGSFRYYEKKNDLANMARVAKQIEELEDLRKEHLGLPRTKKKIRTFR